MYICVMQIVHKVDDCIMSQGELWVTLTKLFQTVPIYDLPYPWLAILIHSGSY